MTVVRYLTDNPIVVATHLAAVSRPGAGAVGSFVGLVRDHHQGRRVVALEYSAYDAMAEQVCGEIVSAATERWDVQVALQHRTGRLVVGDVAVVVAVGARHRDAAFDACRWIIEEVKQRVPVWKREQYADGTEAWVDPTATSTTDATSP
jgi:molybdopterin synthase catalytic subunit